MAKKAKKSKTAAKKVTTKKVTAKKVTGTKTRARKVSPWTTEDHKTLKAHSKSKTPVSKISKAMKRTAGAIRQKARQLGLAIGHRR
jgi:hypothetical protein